MPRLVSAELARDELAEDVKTLTEVVQRIRLYVDAMKGRKIEKLACYGVQQFKKTAQQLVNFERYLSNAYESHGTPQEIKLLNEEDEREEEEKKPAAVK